MAVIFNKTKEMLQAAARYGSVSGQDMEISIEEQENNRVCEHCPRYKYETGASEVLFSGWYHTFLRVMDLHDRRSTVFRAHAAGRIDVEYLFSPPYPHVENLERYVERKNDYSNDDPAKLSPFRLETAIFDYEGSIEDDRGREEKNHWAFVAIRTSASELLKIYEAHYAIEKRNIGYLFQGPNCNSYTMSIEKFAGFTPAKPLNVSAPGWDVYLINSNDNQSEEFLAQIEAIRQAD